MNNLPKTIYLDLGIDAHLTDDFNDLFCVTWSADNATNNGVKYRLVEVSESDEKAAKEYADEFPGSESNYAFHGFLAGCKHKEVEADEKAILFAEWASENKKHYVNTHGKWVWLGGGIATTSELLSSPEFIAYYEESRKK